MRVCSRVTCAGFILLLLFGGSVLPAQQGAIAVGYSSMPGRIGNAQSDHGVVVRLGLDLSTGQHIEWAVEGGMERLNEDNRQFTIDCIPLNGVVTTCHFDDRTRDTGWSLGTTIRWVAGNRPLRPYLLAGVGFLSVRTHYQNSVFDDAGSPLANYSGEGTSAEGALQLHLGAGIRHQPSGSPLALFLEGRATRLIHNYSGGLQWEWNPTVTVGLRMVKR